MSSDSGKIRAVAAVMAAGILWGMLGLAVRHFNAAGLSALDITALRAAGAAIVLWIAAVTFFRSSISIRLRDCWCFAGCGIASIVLFNICYFFTVNRTYLGVAATLLYTSPVFVALMARLFFGERFTLATGAALIMTISGCALVSGIRSGASLAMPIDAFVHATYFTMRAGGKTLITFLFDSAFVWAINVPTVLILTNYTSLSVLWIFAIIQFSALIKCIIGSVLVKKGVWIKNIIK
jgi:drug/metabolite transporter (DMT)-like permease